MARRRFNVFNLAFLDVMSCGLGAVVLFYMIINAQVAVRAKDLNVELLAETNRIEEEILEGRKNLILKRNSLAEQESERLKMEGDARSIQEIIEQLMAELARYEDTTLAKTESVEDLRADIQRLEEAKKRLAATSVDPQEDDGQRVRSFIGEGNRQYLTGMKMGGKRVLILVDTSTSMLARTYVNVLRLRAVPEERRRKAPKWDQVVRSVDWLTTQLQPGTKFQVYGFNETATSLIPGTDGGWVDVTDGSRLSRAIVALRRVTPGKGSSLYAGLNVINDLTPLPDNVYVLTDGLPTLGKDAPATPTSVSERQRIEHFNRATRVLPRRVPINVLLYPMDGDPNAAGYFWDLALRTGGSFQTPSRDWP
jgi:hypothetical protein